MVLQYVKKSTTIFVGALMESWGINASGELVKESEQWNALDNYSTPSPEIDIFLDNRVYPRSMRIGCLNFVPKRDYSHFTGSRKPWVGGVIPDFDKAFAYRNNSGTRIRGLSPWAFWVGAVQMLSDDYGLGLGDLEQSFDQFKRSIGRPALGRKPLLSDLEQRVKRAEKKKAE